MRRIYLAFLLPIFLLSLNEFVLEPLKLYDIISWFDSVMHLIGGIIIGISAILFLKEFESRKMFYANKFLLFVIIVSAVALSAVVWELYEYITSILFNFVRQASVADTVKDLVLGTIGGGVAAVVGVWKK